jgi:hypothetical protein
VRAIRLTIPGRFWDTYVYRGRMYLFGIDGRLEALDWGRLLDVLKIPQNLLISAECAFQRGDYFYGDQWSLLFHDSDMKRVIEGKFSGLSAQKLELADSQIKALSLGCQDSPFPFPHTDLTIYNRRAYACTSKGLFDANCNHRTRYPISSRPEKIWDAAVLCVALLYSAAAVAAGADGLFRLPLKFGYVSNGPEPKRLSNKECNWCSWLYYSIFGRSPIGRAVLADYDKDKSGGSDFELRLNRILSDQDIFGAAGFSWGLQDKLYQLRDGMMETRRYEPWRNTSGRYDSDFEPLQTIDVRTSLSQEKVISAVVCLFGAVVETNRALWILESDGSITRLKGQPTTWRTFPRSKFYGNQLHVVWEDRLEVISFNADYFVDQEKKAMGVRYTPQFGRAE